MRVDPSKFDRGTASNQCGILAVSSDFLFFLQDSFESKRRRGLARSMNLVLSPSLTPCDLPLSNLPMLSEEVNLLPVLLVWACTLNVWSLSYCNCAIRVVGKMCELVTDAGRLADVGRAFVPFDPLQEVHHLEPHERLLLPLPACHIRWSFLQ